MSLLLPEVLMTIKDLQLAAKAAVEGTMAGLHLSKAKGEGLEFSQYRSYQPGDDLRMLDWKLFARSDRYYIREAETERNVTVQLLIDTSASMNHEDSGYNKMDYTRYLAASLAYLAGQQGDAVGLTVFEAGRLLAFPARNGPPQMARLYYELENLQAGGSFTEETHYKNLFGRSAKRELIIFITDYYEQQDEITTMLRAIAGKGKEIMVLHLMGRNEMEGSYKGYSAVEDWETGQVIKIDVQQVAKAYQQRLEAYLTTLRTGLLAKGIFYHRIQMDEPLDLALRHFLNLRNRTKS